jgi:homoserine O-acetyltransferase
MKEVKLSFYIILIFSSIIYSQSGLQLGEIGNFKLTNGDTIYNCKIGYRLFGKMNKDKSNIILFPTWFGGNSKDLTGLIGSNKLINSDKYYVIAVDALGDGVSSSPSNSDKQPDSKFPVFNIEDMVNSQYKLLTGILHINHLYAVFGGSMGGMQTFQWMASYPAFMDKAVPYVGSPKLTSYDLLLWNTELNIIELGHRHNAADEELIKSLAGLQSLQVQTPSYIVENTKPEEYSKYVQLQYENFKTHFNSYNWVSQLKAMLQQDISKDFNGSMKAAAESVKAKVLIIVSETDHMVNPAPALKFAKMINAKTFIFHNNCGHLGPGCDMKKFIEVVNNFLSD